MSSVVSCGEDWLQLPVALRVAVQFTLLNFLSKLHLRRLVVLTRIDFGVNVIQQQSRVFDKTLMLPFCFDIREA